MNRLVVDPAFAGTLREIRRQRGMSLRDLAKVTYSSRTQINALENGTRKPTADQAARLDDALTAGGRLTALVSTPDVELDEDRLAYAARYPRRADPATVDTLAALLAAQRRLEDAIGSVAVLGPATAQLATVSELVSEARDGVRPLLLDVGAQWAQFTGWLNAATDHPDRADDVFSRGLLWATETDDRNMIATLLSFKGYLAEGEGAIGDMIGLSQAAQRDPRVYAAQRAYSAGQEARGRAIAGEDQVAITKISEAVEIAATQDLEAIPPWSYYYTPDFFLVQRGIVFKLLGATNPGRNTQAIELLTAGVEGFTAEARHAEWAGVYLCHLAEAHARAHDLASASAMLAEARQVAAASRSAKVSARVSALARRFGLSPGCP